jgi:hypothetical protein
VTVASSPQVREYSPHDISTRRFWSQPFAVRDNTFAQLRAGDGLSWHRPLPSLFDTVEPGFWAVTRRADIAHVSQHPELFTSTHGVALDPVPAEIQTIRADEPPKEEFEATPGFDGPAVKTDVASLHGGRTDCR